MVKFDITKYDVATPKGLSETIGAILDNKKGKQVTTIDLSDKTVVADYFVIASAYSSTAVKALADAVEEELDKVGVHPLHRDADQKWIALDYGSVIVHVFYKELRDFYNLERLWADGDNVTVTGEEE
ncbi:MAG: ribosome silencing factor [Christensenellales bacterium]